MKIHKTDLISLLDNPWKEVMKEEFSKPYMKELNNFLNQDSREVNQSLVSVSALGMRHKEDFSSFTETHQGPG